MPTRELAFERFGAAIEATRGTAVAAPTHYIPMSGTLDPEFERYVPNEARGLLTDRTRSKVTRRWSNWSGDPMGLDTLLAPFFLNGCVAPTATPTQPDAVGNPTVYLWTFSRVVAADTLKSYTMWWEDPNVATDRAPFAMIDNWSINSDATGGDGATMQFGGFAQDAADVTAPAFPALLNGPLITPLDMQAWLDTTGAMGATALSNSLLAVSIGVSGGRVPKYYPAGPVSTRTYGGVGVQRNHPVGSATFEYSKTLLATLRGDVRIKLRVRMNGPLISGTYYHFVEFDVWATADSIDYGDWADGANRTITVDLHGENDETAQTDLVVRVQNNRSTL